MPLDGMDTTMFVNLIETLNLEYGLSVPQSLILLQLAVRLGQIPLQNYIFNSRYVSSFGQDSELFAKLVKVDLERDLKKLQKEDASVTVSSALKQHYSIGKLMSWGLTAYTQTHIYKALCLISNHPDCYTPYLQDIGYWSSFDPHFALPALVMALNYSLLQNSRHPFFVNVRQHWTPFSKSIFVLYGSGIAMVLPQTYLISYLAFGTTHLLVNKLMQASRGKKESDFDEYLAEKGLR